jgi:hypothetical protein
MTNTIDAWGIKKPDGTLIPAATFEEGALFDMIGLLTFGVSEGVTRGIMEAKGYKSVRVKITEVENE